MHYRHQVCMQGPRVTRYAIFPRDRRIVHITPCVVPLSKYSSGFVRVNWAHHKSYKVRRDGRVSTMQWVRECHKGRPAQWIPRDLQVLSVHSESKVHEMTLARKDSQGVLGGGFGEVKSLNFFVRHAHYESLDTAKVWVQLAQISIFLEST